MKTLKAFVAKRRSLAVGPKGTPVVEVLGFVEGANWREATQAATVKWGLPPDHIIVVVPVGRARSADLRDARYAEVEGFGPDFGKSRVYTCSCGMVTNLHPRNPLPTCSFCGDKLDRAASYLIDVALFLYQLGQRPNPDDVPNIG